MIAASVRQVPVYRPRVLEVQPPTGTVVDTSNARLRWQSQLVAGESGLVLDPPRGSPWTPLVEDVRFYSHEGLSPIEVRRMALGSDAGIRFRDGGSLSKEFIFEVGAEAAALGFSLAVDAMCNLVLMAQCRRGLLRKADAAAAQERRLSIRSSTSRPPSIASSANTTPATPNPFVWKANPDDIIAARNRGFQTWSQSTSSGPVPA